MLAYDAFELKWPMQVLVDSFRAVSAMTMMDCIFLVSNSVACKVMRTCDYLNVVVALLQEAPNC